MHIIHVENLIPSREKMVQNLKENEYDIIVIGGGITGAGVARDATLRGLKVALIEKQDFASGTSSMTSKMLHGGLRYLKNFEFRLVRHAALERKVHQEIAPHLAEVMEFLVPLFKWNSDRPFMLRLGLILYDLLAYPKQIGHHKNLGKEGIMEYFPNLKSDELKGGALYHDVKTNDARLTLANILSATAAGADAVNYCEMTEWHEDEGEVVVTVHDHISDSDFEILGSVAIICAGPWAQIAESRNTGWNGKARVRLTRGTHIILKKRLEKNPVLLINDDERPIFLVPRIDYDLCGTTDIDYKGDPDDVKPTKEEIEYLLTACQKLFPDYNYTRDDIVASFAGVRPLVYKEGVSEGKVSREHTIYFDRPNRVISVFGGKLTTYRRMAREAVDKSFKIMYRDRVKCITEKLPLWGGEIDNWDEFYDTKTNHLQDKFELSAETSHVLVLWYGSEIDYFETYIEKYGKDLLKENRPWLKAQVHYSCEIEFAQTPIDVMRRRLPLMLEEGNGVELINEIANIMSSHLDWSDGEKQKYIDLTKDYIENFIAVNK